ncbi:UNVERIFIED_CONTAM: hypothetical protein GTU68_027098 [Idotea baltica]|nr:hypothetical protein [Idotea baltica]
MNKQLLELSKVGQSVWYDNLSKAVLDSGELKGLIEAGVTGLTSNPTIFKVAIADSNDYDSRLKELMQNTDNADDIAEELMIEDVSRAADLLLEVYNKSNANDGYASIEVSPTLANDTEKTVEAGKRIWGKLNRKNIMIKVPATDAGIPAIQQLLESGINVNVTLIFSVDVYKKVVGAYKNAIKTRIENGEDASKVASVASFFISRVDAICEKEFSKSDDNSKFEKYIGKVGIANSKLAYKLFLEEFSKENFDLDSAMVQKPLWASTGTKNPDFSKVLYVEELSGLNTVNTMPPAVLEEVMKGAVIEDRVSKGLGEAKELIDSLLSDDIPFNELLLKLQEDGVVSFANSYQELIDALKVKIEKFK